MFSGPLVPLVGDALIRDLSLRLGCDLLLVSGEHQRRQLQSLTFNWPASLRSHRDQHGLLVPPGRTLRPRPQSPCCSP